MDKNVHPHQYSPSSSHELPMEPRAKVERGSGKHSVYTQFPKDPNCDICLKTKITMASCRRRAGTVVPRAENVGDLITADHTVLSERCASRHNHRYAVVVQDLATQWLQSNLCKTKTSQETQKSLMKFLEPTRKPKVIYTDNSVGFGKSSEGVVEGTSAVLLQSGPDKEWWADSMECYFYLRNNQDLLSDGKTTYERRFGKPFTASVIPFGAMVEYHPVSAKDISRLHQFARKVLPGILLRLCIICGENLARRHYGRRH